MGAFKSYIKIIFLILLLISTFPAFNQPGTGSPIWLTSPISTSGPFVVDWRADPPQIKAISNLSPSNRVAANTAINRCGEPVFLVMHSGVANISNNLFIYDLDGNPLLDNTTGDSPGLNAKMFGVEVQVILVPGTFNEWYIIYPQFMPNAGAPLNDGSYVPANTLYSRVRYRCNSIEILERDVVLKVSGTAYTYTNGKAISWMPDNPSQLCLYATRRDLDLDYLSIDRFVITSSGISFDKNTGNIYTDTWVLTVDGSGMEVTNDGKWLGFNNRDQSTNGDNFFIFNTESFNNDPANYIKINVGELILQPDYNVLDVAAPLDDVASSNPSLIFLQNLESKLYKIEFSPDGEYLYFVGGGFAGGGLTNTTYLGQIKTGPLDNPLPYPYELRLQIQVPPGPFDSYTGGGGTEADYGNVTHQLIFIERCYDGNLYFIRRNTADLSVIPNPDDPLPVNLVPSELNLSDASHPNITLQGKIWFLPDQIEGYDYINSTNPVINLGEDMSVCGGTYALSPGVGFESYCWQDGSGSAIYYVSGQGTYWVEVIDEFGCIARDTINITYNGIDINLGADISLCAGDSVLISPGTGFMQYLWSDGSTQPELKVKTPGLYWVEVTQSFDCIDRDTVLVTVSANPDIYLGPDSTVCAGQTLTLDAGQGYDQYLWQDGSSSEVYEVKTPGTYWVMVSNEFGCTGSDTIKVTYTGTEISLGNDRSLCEGDSVTLSPGNGFPQYFWSDGSTQSQLTVKDAGMYWVEVEQTGECTYRDSVYVNVNPRPAIALGPDSTICAGEVISLDAGPGFDQYLWQDGSNGRYFNANIEGLYWVEVLNAQGCDGRDSVVLTVMPVPHVELGEDTVIVYDENYLLNAGPGFISYTWQDGSHDQYYMATQDGWYWVEVANERCHDSDSIYVALNDCAASLVIPNCFTPNSDGFNDRFNVVSQNLEGFTMYIFNRWGQQIFETQDVNEGWDGKFKGNKCQVGTYFYLIRYTTPCSFGIEHSGERKGSVTLLE